MVFVFRKLYTVALKCSWNHFISERYKHVQSFKLHLPQNSPLVQLYTPASDYKGFGNIPGSHLVRAFPVPSHTLDDVSSITKAPSLQCLFQVKWTDKNQIQPGQDGTEDAPVLSHCSFLRNPWPQTKGVLEHCCKQETTVHSPFFREFPFDSIPKVTKDVNIHFFIHSFAIQR